MHGHRGHVYGDAVAFSDEVDLAIVRVHRSIKTLNSLRFAEPSDDTGRLIGFPRGKKPLESRPTKIDVMEPWIRYHEDVGTGGMSGGPFVTKQGVVGVHRGEFKTGQGLIHGARLLDVPLLKKLTMAARELLDE